MKTKELMMVAGVAVGLVICFYLIIYKPSSSEIERLRAGLHQYQGLDIREKAVEETHFRKKEEVAELSRNVGVLAERLLAGDDEDGFMKELRQCVTAANVAYDSVKRKGIQKKGSQSYVAFEIRMKGMFENIYSFLRSLEDMEKNVWFDDMKLTKADGEEGVVVLDLSMSVPRVEIKE